MPEGQTDGLIEETQLQGSAFFYSWRDPQQLGEGVIFSSSSALPFK